MAEMAARQVTFCEGLVLRGNPSPLMSNLGFGSSPKSKNSLPGELDCSLFVWSITEPGDSIHIAPSIEDKYLAWKSSLDVRFIGAGQRHGCAGPIAAKITP